MSSAALDGGSPPGLIGSDSSGAEFQRAGDVRKIGADELGDEGTLVTNVVNLDSGELKRLRCRMGWCQAELARRLNCDVDLVWKYEAGEVEIQESHRRVLSSIVHLAENEAVRMHMRPVAEVLMRDRRISQIHDLDVLESWSGEAAETTESN